MAHVAEGLKEKGNALFKAGDFAGAEEQYTLAIQKYPRNPLLFTNRAFSRLKLQRWDGVVDDCVHSIDLTGPTQNFKAYFYLAQAQLSLHRPNEALTSALTAYDQVLHPSPSTSSSSASSLPTISALVLQAKRAKFAARERDRARRHDSLLSELEDGLETQRRAALAAIETALHAHALAPIEAAEQRDEILAAAQKKSDDLRTLFALADPALHAKKEVPDYLIDTITFEVMHDPVVTRNGHSYERATLYEHLKRSPTDPLTREPLKIDDLRPNIALRKACEEFWETASEWAGDW